MAVIPLGQRAPFAVPGVRPDLMQPQQPGFGQQAMLRGLGGLAQGFLGASQQPGARLGTALLGGAAGLLPGLAQGAALEEEQRRHQAAMAQEQAAAAARQQAAQQRLALDAAKAEEQRRQFGVTEGRLGRVAAVEEELGRGSLAARRDELALRRQQFERGRAPDLQVETVRMPDGSVRSFRRADPSLDQALEQGGVRFSAQLQTPDVAGLGGATTSTQTRAQQTIDTATDTLGVIDQFRQSLRPENIGLSGDIRALGIGALGQAESFRAWADNQTQAIIDQALTAGDTVDLSRFAVDPALSSQQLLENVLAYRLAKIQDPSGRISDQDFRNAKMALGTGKKLTSIGDILARVDAFEKTVRRTQGIAERRLGLTPSAQQPATAQQTAPSQAIAQRRQSLGVSQEDLEFTAQQNGLTVEQVLDRLEAR